MKHLRVALWLLLSGCGTLQGQGIPDPSLSATQPPGLTPTPNAVAWRAANGITACGIVHEYRPAMASTPGTLRIGTRTFTIAPGTRPAGSNGFPPTADAPMCVWGGLNGSAAAEPNADPLGDYRCGRVRDYIPATRSANGRITILEYWSDGELELDVPIVGASIGTLRYGDYRCFTIDTPGTKGDAVATGRDTRLADADVACGRVGNYAPASASSPGVIKVGSKTFGLPAGIAYQMDPAGPRRDPIAPGVITCLRAQLDDSGSIARYGPVIPLGITDANGRIGGALTGRVVAFKAPTSAADGYVALALNSVPFRIPAGTNLTPNADAYHRTYDLALDGQGDVIAVGDVDTPPVHVN